MSVVSNEIKNQLMEKFRSLKDEVIIRLYANETRESEIAEKLISEISELHPLIKFEKEKGEIAPVIVITDGKEYGERIKYMGVPVEYEFSTFIDDIIRVSRKSVNLRGSTIKFVKSVEKPMKIEVFVTPSCAYCPHMVKLAHQFAQLNENIEAIGIDAIMFPNLAEKWNVMSVPFTVINEKEGFVGALGEEKVMNKIMEILNK